MLVDKEEFKTLKQQGGGLTGSKLMISVYHEHGLESIKIGETGNLSIMSNGIFYDVTFGKKAFFPLESITETAIENGKLVIITNINKENKIIFRSNNGNSLIKMQNKIAESIGSKSITKAEIKQQEKESKQNQFEKIMSSNPEVEIKPPSMSKGQQERLYQQERIEQLKRDHVPYCPKCHSTQLTYVNKKLSLGRTVVGGAIAGAPGAILGGLTSNKGKVKCLNCGHTWKL